MANKPKCMLQIRRILQLASSGESLRGINRVTGIHRDTISNYLRVCCSSGESYENLLKLKDAELAKVVFPEKEPEEPDSRLQAFLDKAGEYKIALEGCKGMTRKRLWEKHLAIYPDSYSYSQFCEHFARYLQTSDPTMVIPHQPGDALQMDFAGAPLSYIERATGEIVYCPTLVCSLPYSSLTYVDPLESSRFEHLVGGLNRTTHYLGGITKWVLSDNMRQIVTRACRYEPTFTELAEQWAVHNNTFFKATRVGKPKDKPTVEKGVDLAYQNIYAALYEEDIFSLGELRQRVYELNDELNHRPMYKNLPCRMERFLKEEKSFLRTLPPEPFIIKHRANAKVKRNYHVILGEDWHQYSVPFQYIGKKTVLIYDASEVEVYLGLKRIAIHKRDYRRNGYTTLKEHMPESHKKYHEQRGWTRDDFINAARRIGEYTTLIIDRILQSRAFIEQTYDACQGILRLADKYGTDRLEAACRRASQGTRLNYTTIRTILENNQDKIQKREENLKLPFLPPHENIRGPESYK